MQNYVSFSKMPSASEGFTPLTPDSGFHPWTTLGVLPSDHRHRLAITFAIVYFLPL